MSVQVLTLWNSFAPRAASVCSRYTALRALYSFRLHKRAVVSLPDVSHRLMSTHEHDSFLDDDPIYIHLASASSAVPLTKLAMQLPDEVIEQLDGGLKKHLLRFPRRYRVFNDSRGVLHVKLIQKGKTTPFPCGRENNNLNFVLKNRFIPLDSLRAHASQLGDRFFFGFKINGEVDSDTAGDLMIKFIRKLLCDPHSGMELWRLSEEYTTDESEGTSTDAETTVCPSRILEAFSWECIRGAAHIHEALIEPAEGSTFTRRLYVCVRDAPHLSPKVPTANHNTSNDDTDIEALLGCIEDYNIYRLCRVLSTTSYMSLRDVQRSAGDLVTQPLAAVLAIAFSENLLRGRSLLDFCPSAPNDFPSSPAAVQRAVGVRFLLDASRDLPEPYLTMTPAEITAEIAQMQSECPRQKLAASPNHRRVRHMRRLRALQRSLALHERGTTPLCNPDVLAYYVFDALPVSGELVLTGLAPQLLPEGVRSRTDARSRRWMESYPHLFCLVERAPQMFVRRTDAGVAGDGEITEGKDKREKGGKGEGEVRQAERQTMTVSEKRLLKDPKEKLQFVISLVAARLEVMRSRPLLPSHLPKFLNKELRRHIFAGEQRVEGCKTLAFLKRHPDVFVLTYGVHSHEPVVTLKEDFDPKLIHGTVASPAPENTSGEHKDEKDKPMDT